MSVSKEIATIRGTVQQLLEDYPKLRDSDNKLWCRLINNQIGELKVFEITAYRLLCMVANGELPSFESMSRARRELQNEFPHLRGAKYKERQKEQENVITELGYKMDLR